MGVVATECPTCSRVRARRCLFLAQIMRACCHPSSNLCKGCVLGYLAKGNTDGSRNRRCALWFWSSLQSLVFLQSLHSPFVWCQLGFDQACLFGACRCPLCNAAELPKTLMVDTFKWASIQSQYPQRLAEERAQVRPPIAKAVSGSSLCGSESPRTLEIHGHLMSDVC
jgi:hypothetical protein